MRGSIKIDYCENCLPCWTKKYAEFVRLLQVSGIFLFCYFSFSGWAGLFSIVPSLPIYVATIQSVKRGINELVLFLSQAFVCLSCHLPFVFLLQDNTYIHGFESKSSKPISNSYPTSPPWSSKNTFTFTSLIAKYIYRKYFSYSFSYLANSYIEHLIYIYWKEIVLLNKFEVFEG